MGQKPMIATEPSIPMSDALPNIGAVATGMADFNVLILDDSRFDRLRIERRCQGTGLPLATYSVDSVDAFQAALNERRYRLAIVDYRLPDRDGLAALDLVRSHPENSGMAVVMVSGDVSDDMARKSAAGGSFDCLAKDDLTVERIRNLAMATAHVVSEMAQRWLVEAFDRNKAVLTQEITGALVREMQGSILPKLVEDRVRAVLAEAGLLAPIDPIPNPLISPLVDDQPFQFLPTKS